MTSRGDRTPWPWRNRSEFARRVGAVILHNTLHGPLAAAWRWDVMHFPVGIGLLFDGGDAGRGGGGLCPEHAQSNPVKLNRQ